jgi:hypothetical protein
MNEIKKLIADLQDRGWTVAALAREAGPAGAEEDVQKKRVEDTEDRRYQ